MSPMNKYSLIRIFTGYLCILLFITSSSIFYLMSGLIILLFKCKYKEEEYDTMPDITRDCQEATFTNQYQGIIFLVLSYLFLRVDFTLMFYITLVSGTICSSYHKYIFFYRKDCVVSNEVINIKDIE